MAARVSEDGLFCSNRSCVNGCTLKCLVEAGPLSERDFSRLAFEKGPAFIGFLGGLDHQAPGTGTVAVFYRRLA